MYDILFDISRGQVAITNHKKRANLKKGDWLSLRNFVTDISIKMYRNGMLTKHDIQNNSIETKQLEKYFGLDFYIEQI